MSTEGEDVRKLVILMNRTLALISVYHVLVRFDRLNRAKNFELCVRSRELAI